ncbi:unnamed protein product [Rhizoctonia solani]|uniref:Kex protein n=1 Tax=Rhizoctonia solani TaxID=456999 RepID=A0A8H3GWY5_9AGAM|nr:unnamed protein product [Rhizoctonia solani]
MGYNYTIELPLSNGSLIYQLDGNYSIYDWIADHTPGFWLGENLSDAMNEKVIPHLTLPVRPKFGSYTVSITRFSLRRFIVSSPLSDAITGSDPRYNEKFFFPSSLLRREPMRKNETNISSDATMRATGLIYRPSFLDASEQTPYSSFKLGDESLESLCEVTEEYRITNMFDILASIGGLLALLQGLHILLFGRPLFWGLFGAKIIAPFGLMGSLATKGFRERLQERYHYPLKPHSPNMNIPDQGDGSGTAVSVDMTQFLLDYVIDMGPASIQSNEEITIESSDSEDEDAHRPI